MWGSVQGTMQASCGRKSVVQPGPGGESGQAPFLTQLPPEPAPQKPLFQGLPGPRASCLQTSPAPGEPKGGHGWGRGPGFDTTARHVQAEPGASGVPQWGKGPAAPRPGPAPPPRATRGTPVTSPPSLPARCWERRVPAATAPAQHAAAPERPAAPPGGRSAASPGRKRGGGPGRTW